MLFYIFVLSNSDPGGLGIRIVAERAEHIGRIGADGVSGKHPRAAFSGSGRVQSFVSVVNSLVRICYCSFHRKMAVSGFQGIDLFYIKRQCVIIHTVLVRISHPVSIF